MKDESRNKILLLQLHIEGCQVGWREFCILSLMDFAPECCWECSSPLGVSLQNTCMRQATCAELNIVSKALLVFGTFCLMLMEKDSL